MELFGFYPNLVLDITLTILSLTIFSGSYALTEEKYKNINQDLNKTTHVLIIAKTYLTR